MESGTGCAGALSDEELDYVAARLATALGALRSEVPRGDMAEELSLVVEAITGPSGRIWRSARDLLLVILRQGGKARFRDFQRSLPYHDSTMARALKGCLEKKGVVRKEDDFWVLNDKRVPLLSWLASRPDMS